MIYVLKKCLYLVGVYIKWNFNWMYFCFMCLYLLLLFERKVLEVYVFCFVKIDDLNFKIENCFK